MSEPGHLVDTNRLERELAEHVTAAADPAPDEAPDPVRDATPSPAPHTGDALVLSGIDRAYATGSGPLQVLKGANLSIGVGEMVALVAPSGTGKSTLLHIAGLLEHPDAGDVVIDGESAGGLGDEARTAMRRRKVGFVYQFHHLLPEFTAAENLMLPQMIAGLTRAEAARRAHDLLAYLRVDHRAGHRPSEMSGGEQQRVAIARAVVNAPRLLLADEPTGNLDPDTAGHVFRALRELVRESGLAALIATHNFALAAQMDRTVTISGGAVVDAEPK